MPRPSKAELQREREEARRRKQEEEERLRLEEEARKAKEARMYTIHKDLFDRRTLERDTLRALLTERAAAREALAAEVADRDEWEQHLACNELPVATNVRGVNEYVATLTARPCQKRLVLADELAEIRKAHELAESLRTHMSLRQLEGEYEAAAVAQTQLHRVQTAVVERLDAISATMIQFADEREQIDGDLIEEMVDTTGKTEDSFFLFANASLDPDQDVITFKERVEEGEGDDDEEDGGEDAKKDGDAEEAEEEPEDIYASVSLAAPLRVLDCGFRLVQLPSDPLLPDEPLTVPLVEAEPVDPEGYDMAEPKPPKAEGENEDEDEGEGDGDGGGGGEEQGPGQGEGAEAPTPAEGEAAGAAAAAAAAANPEGQAADPATVGADAAPDAEDAGAAAEEAAATAEEVPDEGVAIKEHESLQYAVDLDVWQPVGKVLLFDLFKVPGEKKQIGKWSLRLIESSAELNRLSYPLANAPKVPDPEDPEKSIAARVGLAPWDAVRVTVPLVDSVVHRDETPKLAWWCAHIEQWCTDGFSEVVMNREKGQLSFATEHVAPITMLQEIYPTKTIHHWELGPAGGGGATLTLEGDAGITVIRVDADGVRLVEPADVTALAHLRDTARRPDQFVAAMIHAQHNVFPGLENPPGYETPHAAELRARRAAAAAAAADADVDAAAGHRGKHRHHHHHHHHGKHHKHHKHHKHKHHHVKHPKGPDGGGDGDGGGEGAAAAAASAAHDKPDAATVEGAAAAAEGEGEGEGEEDQNVCPIPRPEPLVDVHPPTFKSVELEQSVYRQLSLLAQHIRVRESVWHNNSDEEHVVLRIQPGGAAPDNASAWSTLYLNAYHHALPLRVTEWQSAFDDEIADGEGVKMHGTLYHAIKAMLPDDVRGAADLHTTTSVGYAVLYLLSAVCPLRFSSGTRAREAQNADRIRLASEWAAEEARKAEEAKRLEEEAAAEAAAAAGGASTPGTPAANPTA